MSVFMLIQLLFVLGYNEVVPVRTSGCGMRFNKVNIESVSTNATALPLFLWDVFGFVASIFNCAFPVRRFNTA